MGKWIFKYLVYFKKCMLSLIYDECNHCCICKESLENGYLCDPCSKKLTLNKEPSYEFLGNHRIRVYSCMYYNNYAKDLILRLKSKKDFSAGEALAKFMINSINDQSIDFHYIIPVPISKEKFKKRGFNQSVFLSRIIGEYFNKEVLDILYINRSVNEQKILTREERLANLSSAFSVNNLYRKKIKGKNILLIDDVITTGATIYNCSMPLIEDCDNYIWVLTVAKSSI